ncbi:MAG: lactoylglutathione lyase [Bacteroidetes bacterium HGW-Bacteroidetes-12]|nr:MAG: lactoylglutathione lyase [Bacteroidetes bacterium HGW-Bacteroidetes-12]
MQIEFILYVADQEKSKDFYEALLAIKASLHVPGMTEFQLSETTKLGLMPENGIATILGNATPLPNTGNGIPRCELYLKVKHANEYMERGMRLGAKLISPLQQRDWGDKVGYLLDADGHVIAFAEE